MYTLTSKQRAQLRALANPLDTILQVGKGGIGPAVITGADNALTARELIKGRVLQNSEYSSKEAAEQIAEQTGSQVVQVIGTRFVLYRPNPEKKLIELV
ncbi:MAG: ribosome assembly RNA-binding protein YhbY [Oscillospiraceae bacterium]|nr:ribosome assembly RNA-binding protein YhbY [Oscillospiraceae bacterium]